MRSLLAVLFFLCSSILPSSLSMMEAVSCEAKDTISVIPAGYEGGGRFTSIAISPLDPHLVIVGSDVAGVFKSSDECASFQLKDKGLEGFAVADILIDPVDPLRMVMLTADGLYSSSNKGESWKKQNGTLRYESRLFGSRLMVLSKDALWVATDRNGIFKVKLDASPWTAVAAPGLENIKVNALASLGDTIYAGTAKGVFCFVNGGWQECSQGLPAGDREIMDLFAHPKGRLYSLAKNSGLYAWNESQKKWEGLGPGTGQSLFDRVKAYKAMAVDPQNPDIVFIASHPETWPHILYKSSDAGKTWKKITSFQLDPQAAETFTKSLEGVERIAFFPSDPKRMLLADWANIWESRDGGESWGQIHKGLQNTCVNSVGFHPASGQKIFLAVADNGLVASEDGGRSWKRKMSGVAEGNAQALEINPRDPSKMYLLMNPWNKKDRVYVYKSSDGGKSWEDIGFPLPADSLPKLCYVDGLATNLVLAPGSDNILYVGTNGYGIFKSENGGGTWHAVNRGLTTPFVKGPNAILIDPRNPEVLFAGTQQGGVFKSQDGGNNWTPVSSQYPWAFGMAMDPSKPSRIFACRPEKKIIVSEDGGSSWTQIALPGGNPEQIAANAVAVHPLDPKTVVVGTLAYTGAADGIYVSHNGGRDFSKMPVELPNINIFCLQISRTPGLRFLVGLNGAGAFLVEAPGK